MNLSSMQELLRDIVSITATQYETLNIYLETLEKWNRTLNLTGFDKKDWWDRIILESIALVDLIPESLKNRSDTCWMDMGTGAGIPGLAVAAIFPEKLIYLVDSRSKKTDFVKFAARKMKLNNVQVLSHRLEDIEIVQAQLNKPVDLFLSRALAEPEILIQYAEPFAESNAWLISPRSGTNREKEVSLLSETQVSWCGNLIMVSIPGSKRQVQCLKLRKVN